MSHRSKRHSPTHDDYADRRVRLRAKVFTDLQQTLPVLGLIFILAGAVQALFCYIPPYFADPRWEQQLFTRLVDCTWLPLIGLILILIPFSKTCTFWHLKVRGAATWVSLIAGIATLLLVAYGIFVTVRVAEAQHAVPDTAYLATLSGTSSVSAQIAAIGEIEDAQRLQTIELWGSTIKSSLLGLLAGAGFVLLFARSGVYRYLLHQDAIGKGEHVGISRDDVSEEEELV